MYSFMGIWTILEELLSFKVIATLRDMKTNITNKQNKTNKNRLVGQEYMTLTEYLTDWLTDW